MSKYFDVIKERRDEIQKGITSSVIDPEALDWIEKGRGAQVGEIRDWRGNKMQKQADGSWKPAVKNVKPDSADTESESKGGGGVKTFSDFLTQNEKKTIPSSLQSKSKDQLLSDKERYEKLRDNRMIASSTRQNAKEMVWNIDTLLSAHKRAEDAR